MPELRYFEVTQTRKVKVSANFPADAVRIAEEAFTNGQNANGHILEIPDVFGNTFSRVRVTHIEAQDERG